MLTTFTGAQADMRRGYCSGAPGILASGLAWAVAAATALLATPQHAVWALLIGGALIHPVGMLLSRLLGAPGTHTRGNPLAALAGASTVWLIASLPLAYGVGLQRPAWFFAAMLLVIGSRYLVFATLYGMTLYRGLGLALVGAGAALGSLGMPSAAIATAGAALEVAFAAVAFAGHRAWVRTASASPAGAGGPP